jgi:hypothetical protein
MAIGEPGLIASDVISAIPHAFLQVALGNKENMPA